MRVLILGPYNIRELMEAIPVSKENAVSAKGIFLLCPLRQPGIHRYTTLSDKQSKTQVAKAFLSHS